MAAAKVWVKPHKWKKGKKGTHPGYWRKKRPKGKRKIISPKPVRLYSVMDEYGRKMGWSKKPPAKRKKKKR